MAFDVQDAVHLKNHTAQTAAKDVSAQSSQGKLVQGQPLAWITKGTLYILYVLFTIYTIS